MKRTFFRTLRGGLILATAVISLTCMQNAEAAWPDHPITLVVPFPAGGNADLLGRIVAVRLTAALGEHVIVLNRPGAGSMLGSQYVANAKPDGYTIMMGSVSNVLDNFFYKKPLYNIKELAPVSRVADVPNYFAVNPTLNIHSVADLIAYAKQNPGQASCATSGIGTSPYLSCVLFIRMAGLNMTDVPYQGGTPAIQDTMGGRETLAIANEALPYIKNGLLRGIAVSSAQRSPLAPDLPSISETLPGYDVTSWYGVFAPTGTPPAIIDQISKAIQAAMLLPDVKKQLAVIGAVPVGDTQQQFQEFLDAQIAKWGKLAKVLNIHIS